MKWVRWLICAVLVLVVLGSVVSPALARDILKANADHSVPWNDVYSGETDYIYCSWSYLSGRPHDAWKVQIPLYYVEVLDHWDGGSMWTEPGYYTWFIIDKVKAGDSSPYDSYHNLPAPWIKVKYHSNSEITKTYTCKVSLWDHLFDFWGIPIFYKAIETTSSFTLTIHPNGILGSINSENTEKTEKVVAKTRFNNIKDFTKFEKLALIEGKIAVMKALKINRDKKIDAITLEYDNGCWVIKGYKLKGNTFDNLVFEYKQQIRDDEII